MTQYTKGFSAKEIKQIAKSYIFSKGMTYKKLGELYNCSGSTISQIMNSDLQKVNKKLYFLAKLKARRNAAKSVKQLNRKR